MKAGRKSSAPSKKLRTRAEQLLATTRREVAHMPVADMQKLVHELQVHQIELEMQNDELRRTQQELEAARDRYADLYDFAPCAHLTLNADGEILEANLSAGQLFGLERVRLIHQKLTRFIAAEAKDAFYLFCRQVFSAEGRHITELELVTAQGRRRPVHVEAVSDPASGRKQGRFSFIDITAHEQVEQSLRESEQFAQCVVDSLAANIAIVDQKGRIVAVNQHWRDFAARNGTAPEAVSEGANYLAACGAGARKHADIATIVAGLNDLLAGRRREFHHEYACHSPTEQRWFSLQVTPFPGNGLRQVVVAHEDITERKQAEAAWRASEARFQLMTATIEDVLYSVDGVSGEFLYVSPAFERLLGYTLADVADMGGREKFLANVIQGGGFTVQQQTFHQLQAGQPAPRPARWQAWWRCKNGGLRCFEDCWIPLYTGDTLTSTSGVLRDITERKRTEQLLQRANRTLQAIRDCHEAMLRAQTEHVLLEEICQIIVQTGGERMAWAAFAEKNARKSVRPVASAGVNRDYLSKAHITWADEPRGRGPVGVAIRTGKVSLCHNTLTDPNFAPWRAGARRNGYGSVIALPLKVDGRCIGALCIYAAEPDAFDATEQLLLMDLANDLAFGISTLRLRAERERLEDELLKSVESEQERIGRDLHDGLCQVLVGAKYRSVYLRKIAHGKLQAVEEEARALEEALNQAIEQARELSRGLNPVKVTPAGFAAALQKLADNVVTSRGPNCFCHFPEPVKISDHHVACHLYRIAQEAVQNALKHARAKTIAITLARQDGCVVLTIKDDGVGIARRRKKTGMGLHNMQTRARLIGGRLELRRRTHGGTAVRCELPQRADQQL